MTRQEALDSAKQNSIRRSSGCYDVYQIIDTDRYLVGEDLSGNDRLGGYDQNDLRFVARYVAGKKQ
jgi:hypothetical protein